MRFSELVQDIKLNFSDITETKSLGIVKTEDFINESADRLDISILAANKFLNSGKKLEWFFNTPVEIEAKTDGVKVTALKIADDGDLSDWIIAYKGHILYSEEFNYNSDDNIKKSSIGSSQFKIVLDHFKSLGKTSIPVGTELQLEYLMRKPTLSSNYEKPHGIVLIGYSKSTYSAEFGILKTQNSGMKTAKRDIYAKELKLNVPLKIFDGILSSKEEFEKGIIAKDLKIAFNRYKDFFNFSDYTDTYNRLSSMLLGIPSVFGGKEEGVVLKFSDGKILKIQQDYQLDRAKRDEKKAQYQGTEEEESSYIDKVNSTAREVATNILDSLSDKELYDEDLKVDKLSSAISKLKLSFSHPKKTELQIKEDILRSAKTFMFANTKGNKNFLFLGKFRILQNAHYNIIKSALRQYDKGVVCLVSSKDTKGTEKLRLEMLERAFGDRIKVITHPTGNIWGILGKSPLQISTIFCGTDRYDDYKKQVSKSTIEVKEIKRDLETGLSASKVIANIDDEEFFKKNTPKEIHSMYPEIRAVYSRESLKESLKESMFDVLKSRNLF